jgi:hypothetical protein
VRDAAAVCISRLMTRPDMQRDQLRSYLAWATDTLAACNARVGGAAGEGVDVVQDALLQVLDSRQRVVVIQRLAGGGAIERLPQAVDDGPDFGGDRFAGDAGVLAKTRDAEAVPALVGSLAYVPLRPAIAETLGAVGDARAKAPGDFVPDFDATNSESPPDGQLAVPIQ